MKSYNKLKPALRRIAVEHGFFHLRQEIALISPRAIIALGNAAAHACFLLAKEHGSVRLQLDGVEKQRDMHHILNIGDNEISLHVTFLPGILSERFSPNRILKLQSDVPKFLACVEKQCPCQTA